MWILLHSCSTYSDVSAKEEVNMLNKKCVGIQFIYLFTNERDKAAINVVLLCSYEEIFFVYSALMI